MSATRLVHRDLDSFFRVPLEQYGPADAYVSPLRGDLAKTLDGRTNPVFGSPDQITYMTFERAGRPVGRITAHIHARSNERHGLRRGSFGYFDCANDPEAACALLDAASEWLARRGCDEIVGNFNLTAMQEMGVVVDGHDLAPFTAQHHNPRWIPELLTANGFEPFFPMTTWSVDLGRVGPDALLGPRQRALLEDADLVLTPIGRWRFRATMESVRLLLNASFEANPLFVPLTREEFLFQAEQMLPVLDPRIAFIARHRGEPVGVVACLPDANELLRATGSRLGLGTPLHYLRFLRRRRGASLVFGGITPEMQNRGLGGLLFRRALIALRSAGYDELGITWISDSNHASLRQMEKVGARPRHRLNLFRRPLGAGRTACGPDGSI
jgi:GNAT superfamily N-acetyltransferase